MCKKNRQVETVLGTHQAIDFSLIRQLHRGRDERALMVAYQIHGLLPQGRRGTSDQIAASFRDRKVTHIIGRHHDRPATEPLAAYGELHQDGRRSYALGTLALDRLSRPNAKRVGMYLLGYLIREGVEPGSAAVIHAELPKDGKERGALTPFMTACGFTLNKDIAMASVGIIQTALEKENIRI